MELMMKILTKELLTIWLCQIVMLLPLAWSRSLTVSLNLTLTRTELPADSEAAPSTLGHAVLQSCMRKTEVSMSQLKLYRMSLLNNDDTADNNDVVADDSGSNFDVDYAINAQLDLRRSEPLQCFVRCLYEQLGLLKYNMLLEHAISGHLQSIMQHERPEIKECHDLQSNNHCEAAYKLHLCSIRLSTLQAEQRIREMLERSEVAATMLDSVLGNEEQNKDTATDITEGIIQSV